MVGQAVDPQAAQFYAVPTRPRRRHHDDRAAAVSSCQHRRPSQQRDSVNPRERLRASKPPRAARGQKDYAQQRHGGDIRWYHGGNGR